MRNIFTLQSYFLERDVRTLNGYQEFFDNTDIPELKKATQALLVNGLGDIYADVGFYEKGSGKWKPVFTTYAFVGKSGFLPNKKEGDGGSPEGVFRFTHAFGINEDPGCSAFPYFKVTDDDYWCGISGTPYYNQPVKASEHPELGFDRDNSEHLIDYDPGYQYASCDSSFENNKNTCFHIESRYFSRTRFDTDYAVSFSDFSSLASSAFTSTVSFAESSALSPVSGFRVT